MTLKIERPAFEAKVFDNTGAYVTTLRSREHLAALTLAPGWRVQEEPGQAWIRDPKGMPIALVCVPGFAPLFAAAPEMREALRAAEAFIGAVVGNDSTGPVLTAVRAALAAANEQGAAPHGDARCGDPACGCAEASHA